MNKDLTIGIVGATGAVGDELLKLLAPHSVEKIQLFASPQSKGKTVSFQNRTLPLHELTPNCFQGLSLVFFSAGAERSRQYAPQAVQQGALVIDNSSAFRLNPEVPLVIPEINPSQIPNHKGILAVPNCTTIILLMAIAPIAQKVKIKKIVASSYQAVSGAGKKGVFELEEQLKQTLTGKPLTPPEVFPYPIAFNAIPQVDVFLENGYTKEEMKVIQESQKILQLPQLDISATCVRVPVKRAHSVSAYVQTESPLTKEQFIQWLENFPGVVVFDDPSQKKYPHALACSHQREVFVGRIRQDLRDPCGLHFWVVGDQLLKGAAWNAYQIAQHLFPVLK